MSKYLSYSIIKGIEVAIYQDDCDFDYEIRLNDLVICNTGDEIEAEVIAESLHLALTVLDMKGMLK